MEATPLSGSATRAAHLCGTEAGGYRAAVRTRVRWPWFSDRRVGQGVATRFGEAGGVGMGYLKWGHRGGGGLSLLAGCETDPAGGIRADTEDSGSGAAGVSGGLSGADRLRRERFRVVLAGPARIGTSDVALVPCRGGDADLRGDRPMVGPGHVTRGVWNSGRVSGAYPGRVFYLSPGGDGYMIDGHSGGARWPGGPRPPLGRFTMRRSTSS